MNDERKVRHFIAVALAILGLGVGRTRNLYAQDGTPQDYEALQARQNAINMLKVIEAINNGQLSRVCLFAETSLKIDKSILDPSSNLKVSSDVDKAKNDRVFKQIQDYLEKGKCQPHA